jgi:hypothetical protein
MYEACEICGMEKKIVVETLKERNHLGDTDINKRITLKLMKFGQDSSVLG